MSSDGDSRADGFNEEAAKPPPPIREDYRSAAGPPLKSDYDKVKGSDHPPPGGPSAPSPKSPDGSPPPSNTPPSNRVKGVDPAAVTFTEKPKPRLDKFNDEAAKAKASDQPPPVQATPSKKELAAEQARKEAKSQEKKKDDQKRENEQSLKDRMREAAQKRKKEREKDRERGGR